jgi:hypothetical protein
MPSAAPYPIPPRLNHYAVLLVQILLCAVDQDLTTLPLLPCCYSLLPILSQPRLSTKYLILAPIDGVDYRVPRFQMLSFHLISPYSIDTL